MLPELASTELHNRKGARQNAPRISQARKPNPAAKSQILCAEVLAGLQTELSNGTLATPTAFAGISRALRALSQLWFINQDACGFMLGSAGGHEQPIDFWNIK